MTAEITSPEAWRGPSPLDRVRYFFGGLRYRYFPGKSSLETFAEHELSLLLGDEGDDDMQVEMNRHLLKMVRTFSREGHSGFSARYAIGCLKKLLAYEPLTPLTGTDDEWNEVGAMMGQPCWQNRRCSHVFKDGDGQAYDIHGKVFVEPDGCSYTGSGSRVNITFPYTPAVQYVNVDSNGNPLDGSSRD